MGKEQDIERMAEQERRLRFDRFDNATAWELGTRVKALLRLCRLAPRGA
jgi:uncharacterized protein (UPF0303 family)